MNRTIICLVYFCSLLGLSVTATSAQDATAIQAGETLYAEHCAECHGEKLRDSGSFPDLREMRADQRREFERVVTDGQGQMPSWSGILNAQQIDQLWSYIRSRAR